MVQNSACVVVGHIDDEFGGAAEGGEDLGHNVAIDAGHVAVGFRLVFE
jgi:hypothetical protein